MKITPSVNNPAVRPTTSSRDTGVSTSHTPAAAKSAVDLSPAARQLAGLHNASGDIDVRQIEKIRDAIAAGELKINPERIADSLLASARELLK